MSPALTDTDPQAPPPPATPLPSRRFVRGSIWILGSTVLSQGVRLVGNLVFWRLLSPDAFGLMSIVNALIVGLAMFSDIGLAQSVIQHERGDDPVFLNTVWTLHVIRGVALALISAVLAYPLAHFYHQPQIAPLVLLVSGGMLIGAFNSTRLFTASRNVALGRVTVIDAASQLGSLAFMVFWAWRTHSAAALAIGSAVSAAIRLYLSHTALPGIRNRFHWDADTLRALARFGRWVFISTILTFLSSNSDRLIFGKLISMDMLGVYSVAFTWATLPSSLSANLINGILFPLFSRLSGDSLRQSFARHRRMVLIAGAWLSACLLAGGPTLIAFLYDSRAREASVLVQILAIGAWFSTMEAANSAATLSLGLPKWLALGNAAKTLSMLILVPLGAKMFGFRAMVLALSLSDVSRYAVSIVACGRFGLFPFWQDVVLSVAVASSAVVGLLARQGYRHLHLHISRPRIDALLEGVCVLITLTAIWLAFFLVARRMGRSRPAPAQP